MQCSDSTRAPQCDPPGAITKTDAETLARFEQSARRYWRLAEQAVQASGLALREYDLLLVLSASAQPWVTIRVLADRLQQTAAKLYEVVDGSETLGFVARRHQPSNRRIIEIGLTADGQAALTTLVLVDRQHLGQFVPALGACVRSAMAC